MCGICGSIDPEGVSRDHIQVMTSALAHRGPDDEGLYVDGMAGIGHRRLSIIDVDGGHQPLCNEDGTLWIVFNGEIYNYREIRSRLPDSHRFATESDTEVILHLYEEKRERCVDQLRGMFAFAIWDSREQTLFLARDHLGQKPLFYVHHAGRFSFGSEIKSLLAADPSLRDMDLDALHQYLTLRIIAPPLTMFASVRKVPPGHTVLFKNGQLKIERFWDLHYEPKHQLSEEDLIDKLEQQMLEAVRYHMISDVPVGAFLSGGLDSSLVVAMMSKVSGQQIKTFSIDVPYQNYSEAPYARKVAEMYDTQHFEETITPSLIKVLPELIWHLDEPSDPLSAPMYYISEMARREVKVVLGGDGGDELFGGYDRYYGNQYVGYYAQIPPALRTQIIGPILGLLPDGSWYKSLGHKLKWMHQLSYHHGGRRYTQSLSYFYFTEEFRNQLYGDHFINELDGFDPEEAVCKYYESDNALEMLDKMLYADSMVRLPDHPVMILDRMTMAHGLEARSPFMDHILAEFAARIPTNLKVRGRTRRYIQTRIAERYLPPELLQREKQGFSSGLPYMLVNEFRQLFETFLLNSHLVRDDYLNGESISYMLSGHLQGKADHGNRLWLLCNAEVWYRMAIEGWSKDRVADRLNNRNIPIYQNITLGE